MLLKGYLVPGSISLPEEYLVQYRKGSDHYDADDDDLQVLFQIEPVSHHKELG